MSAVRARSRASQGPLLVDEFNSRALPELTPPIGGAQPWTWLADRETDPEERTAYLARFVHSHGWTDPTDRDLELVPRTPGEVIAGHLTQRVFLDLAGAPPVRLRLSSLSRPAQTDESTDAQAAGVSCPTPGGSETVGVFPFRRAVAIVGTTAPQSEAASFAGQRLDEELADFLTGRDIGWRVAVAVASSQEWLDRVLLVDYDADPSGVRFAAATHLQPFLTVWRPVPRHPGGRLEVLDLTDPLDAPVVGEGSAAVHQVSVRACPLIPDAGCGDLCRVHGGPWVSRSITAAARWERRHARLIRALGCDTCGDGAIKVFMNDKVIGSGRGAIPIRPDVSTPTRHDTLRTMTT